AARRRAISRPTPLEPPVISARFPLKWVRAPGNDTATSVAIRRRRGTDASADPHLGDASVADEELDRAPPVEAVAGHVDGHRVPIGLAVPRNVDDLEMRALADVVRPVPFAYAVVPAELATPVVQVGVSFK